MGHQRSRRSPLRRVWRADRRHRTHQTAATVLALHLTYMSLPAASPSPYRRPLSSIVPSRRVRRLAVVVLVFLSLGSLALSPLHETVERVKEVVPWAGGALAVSEALFVAGLAIIAWPAGAHLGWNPLRWHHRLGTLLRAGLAPTATFWIGLAVNTVGAVGSAVAVLVAVVVGLPPSAWGLVVLPLADLLVTIGLRSAVVVGARGNDNDNGARGSVPGADNFAGTATGQDGRARGRGPDGG